MREIEPHEPGTPCLGPDDLRRELIVLARLDREARGNPPSRPRIAEEWPRDPLLGPEDLRRELASAK